MVRSSKEEKVEVGKASFIMHKENKQSRDDAVK
jgi:hypothetical protein